TSMLSLSRLEAGEMKTNPEVFDLSETLLRTLLSFEQRIEEKKLTIEGTDSLCPAVISADPDLIHQV
ncbi:MAG TPA: sensor histidine kinase, partial [Ruminococcaceae bacterium]|nr:sensor histidine kinase [Oscillospiraceae bacterium]